MKANWANKIYLLVTMVYRLFPVQHFTLNMTCIELTVGVQIEKILRVQNIFAHVSHPSNHKNISHSVILLCCYKHFSLQIYSSLKRKLT